MLIAIKRADGGVSIMNVIEPEGQKLKKADRAKLIEAEVAKWGEARPGQYVSHREISEEAVPRDRTFRDAWTDDKPTPTVDVDMGKARDIHMRRLRAARNEKLTELDLESLKAMEAGDEAGRKRIAARKQALRDMPQATDLSGIESAEELRAFVPDALKGE